jgi:hypothetical protein
LEWGESFHIRNTSTIPLKGHVSPSMRLVLTVCTFLIKK